MTAVTLSTNPVTITVWSSSFARQQALGAPVSYSFTPRLAPAGLGDGSIVTAVDDPVNQYLGLPGARITAEYRGEVALSGWVHRRLGPVIQVGTVEWDVYSDDYLLAWTLGWVNPAAPLQPASLTDPAQSVPPAAGHGAGIADGSGYYAFPSAPAVYPAETAIKRLVSDNFARLGRPVTIAPDLGRGGDARAAGWLPAVRFDPLDQALAPLCDSAGLGIRIVQQPGASGLALDVVVPVAWAQAITYDSGILTDGTYQQEGPTATRAVLGGPGDDAARAYYGQTDATGLEATYGVVIEQFVDATGATITWPSTLAAQYQVPAYFLTRTDVDPAAQAAFLQYLQATANLALGAGRPSSGLDVTLSETAAFHYGGTDGYHVGDYVPVSAASGPTITDQVTEVTLAYDSSGFKVTPKVGSITQDTTQQLAQLVAALAATVQRRNTRQ